MPSKDVEVRNPLAAPALFEVTQGGENNTNIAHVEHANMPVLIVQQTAQASSTALPMMSLELDWRNYHLFVIAGEDFSTGRFFVDPTRALTEYTSDELKQRYQHLTPAAIEELKRFPALFMAENEEFGKATSGQYAYWGYLTDIRVQDNGIRITFTRICPVPQQKLNENNNHFGIFSRSRFSELNRTHWALKRVNLHESFNEAGINYMPINVPQGGIQA